MLQRTVVFRAIQVILVWNERKWGLENGALRIVVDWASGEKSGQYRENRCSSYASTYIRAFDIHISSNTEDTYRKSLSHLRTLPLSLSLSLSLFIHTVTVTQSQSTSCSHSQSCSHSHGQSCSHSHAVTVSHSQSQSMSHQACLNMFGGVSQSELWIEMDQLE